MIKLEAGWKRRVVLLMRPLKEYICTGRLDSISTQASEGSRTALYRWTRGT